MRILIADDHEVVRRGVRSLLEVENDCEVCGEAPDGRFAVTMARELRPDAVIMDVSMPNMNGLDAAREINQLFPQIAIIMLSQHDSSEIVRQSLAAGARAYVVKSAISTDLVAALRAVQTNKRDEAPMVFGSAQNTFDVQEVVQRSAAFEKELQDTTERLRLAQEVTRVGTFEWNIQTGVNRWTNELERIYGLEPGTFAGTQTAWERLIHRDDRDEMVRRVTEAKKNGHFEGEWRVIWPDGSVKWVLGRASVLRDEAGTAQRLIGVNIDITDRKRAEEELVHQGERQRALLYFVEALNQANSFTEIYTAALDGISSGLKCSRAALMLCDDFGALRFASWRGISEEHRNAVQAHHFWQLDPTKRQPVCIEGLDSAGLDQSAKALLQREGVQALSLIPVFWREKFIGELIAYYDETHLFDARQVEFSLTIAHDLALGIHRRRTEEELAERASLLDLSSDAIVVRDFQDRVIYWNRAATELYGYTREEATGRITHQMFATQFSEPLDQITSKLYAEDRWSGQLLHTRKDGSTIAVSSRWCLARDENGRVKSVLETNRDITAELALNEIRDKLTEKNSQSPTLEASSPKARRKRKAAAASTSG